MVRVTTKLFLYNFGFARTYKYSIAKLYNVDAQLIFIIANPLFVYTKRYIITLFQEKAKYRSKIGAKEMYRILLTVSLAD